MPQESFDDVTAPPDGIWCAKVGHQRSTRRTVMSVIATVGLDLAKNVFQLLGGDGDV